MNKRAETALEDPQARLERALIEEFLQTRGESLATVNSKPPSEQQSLLVQAARYTDVRLAEIDARAHYIQQIHGGTTRT